jgi:hypothetical protein
MKLTEFIEKREVDFSNSLVKADDISRLEKLVEVTFGKELKLYILRYGYLGYKHVELYGINSKQMADSDMIKQTLYLHKYFPETKGCTALENTGDGDYMIVACNDDVFEYSTEEGCLQKTGLKLFEYIIDRFQKIDE